MRSGLITNDREKTLRGRFVSKSGLGWEGKGSDRREKGSGRKEKGSEWKEEGYSRKKKESDWGDNDRMG